MTTAAILLAAAIVSAPLYGLWYELRARRVKAAKTRAEMVWASHSDVTYS